MFIGRVVGSLWATRKTENTEGMKFLIIQPFNFSQRNRGDHIVVADVLGAGEGEMVMYVQGRASRIAVGNENMSINAAVTGIIDEYEVKPEFFDGEIDQNKIVFKKHVSENA